MTEQLEVRLLSLALVEPLEAAHRASEGEQRELTVVARRDGGLTGWGECSALTTAGYTGDTARSAFELLTSRSTHQSTHPMAAAALEMADLDLELRRRMRSLPSHLGITEPTIRAGATVGLGEVVDVVGRVDRLVADGYRRVKLKIVPGHDVDVLGAVRARHPDLELHCDANGSYSDEGVMGLAALDDLGVAVIEQPVAVGHEALAQRLVDTMVATIVLDESIRSRADAERLHHAGLLSGMTIKPALLGGIGEAVALVAWGADRDVPMMIGGLLESGLGRHALAAVAALPGINLVGDLSPAHRWLAVDPWPDLSMRRGEIVVPSGPGVAPSPDADILDEVTLAQEVVELD